MQFNEVDAAEYEPLNSGINKVLVSLFIFVDFSICNFALPSLILVFQTPV
jgi:hypothetical protein